MKQYTAWILGVLLLVPACSYQWQGFDVPAIPSVVGDGSNTLYIAEVEQASLYPWVDPYIRAKVRDEIHLRKLALLVDTPGSDYTLHIRVPSFLIRAYVSDRDDQTLLNSATATMEMEVRQGDGTIVWRSGLLRYSERYEDPSEQDAYREVLIQLIYRGLDRMQESF